MTADVLAELTREGMMLEAKAATLATLGSATAYKPTLSECEDDVSTMQPKEHGSAPPLSSHPLSSVK